MWSISKPKIKNNPKFTLNEDQLSIVDTVNFFVYGLTQFVAGAFGDAYSLNIILPVSFTV
jgi:sugar phosphate permease